MTTALLLWFGGSICFTLGYTTAAIFAAGRDEDRRRHDAREAGDD